MQIKKEEINPCLLSFEVTVEPEKYAEALGKARKLVAKNMEVPGFRKGKAPAPIVDKLIDNDRVVRIANDEVMHDSVLTLIKDEDIEPWDSPSVEVMEPEVEGSFRFKTQIPLNPNVELGNYKGLQVERSVRRVTDDIISAEIDRMAQQQTRLEPVEEGARVETSDYIYFTIQELDDKGECVGEPVANAAIVGENVPDFDKNVVGMVKDETKEFTIKYPKDWGEKDRAGKSVKVRVVLNMHFKQNKPVIDDEFAKSATGHESLDALRQDIAKAAEQAFMKEAEEKVTDSIIRQIIENSTIHYPPQLLNDELKVRLHDFFHDLEQRRITLEQYLKDTNQTQEQLLEHLKQVVDVDLKVGLALAKIAEKENLEITEEEIDEEVSKVEEAEVSERFKNYAASMKGRTSIARRKLLLKTLDFLVSVSNIKDVTVSEKEPKAAKEAKK